MQVFGKDWRRDPVGVTRWEMASYLKKPTILLHDKNLDVKAELELWKKQGANIVAVYPCDLTEGPPKAAMKQMMQLLSNPNPTV